MIDIPWWLFLSVLAAIVVLLVWSVKGQGTRRRRRRADEWTSAPEREHVKVVNGVTWIWMDHRGWVTAEAILEQIDDLTETFEAMGKVAVAATEIVAQLRDALDSKTEPKK